MQHWPWYLLIDECFLDLSVRSPGIPSTSTKASSIKRYHG